MLMCAQKRKYLLEFIVIYLTKKLFQPPPPPYYIETISLQVSRGISSVESGMKDLEIKLKNLLTDWERAKVSN